MERYRIYRWIGRLSGFLGLVFFVSFFVGRALDIIKSSNSNFDLLFLLTLFSFALVANIIGWFIEIIGGGLLLLCGMVLGFAVAFSDVLNTLTFTLSLSLPFLIPGVFFILSWRSKFKLKENTINKDY
jgi:F0F1-type ATP synthase membrane subunit a